MYNREIRRTVIMNHDSETCNIYDRYIEERTGDRLGASGAPLGEKLAETFGAIRFVVARRESLSRQGVVAVAASEAVSVPRLVLVCHAAASDDLRQTIHDNRTARFEIGMYLAAMINRSHDRYTDKIYFKKKM